jgi:hypothetical protein
MPSFDSYVGIRYSGRKAPKERIDDLLVFAARGDHEPYRELNRDDGEGRFSRQELAEWLLGRLREDERVIVGLDHAFSFPQSYMHRHGLESWEAFLRDFEEHWPTHRLSVKELLPGLTRLGDPDEQRLAGRWTAFPRSVFQFDLQDNGPPASSIATAARGWSARSTKRSPSVPGCRTATGSTSCAPTSSRRCRSSSGSAPSSKVGFWA